MQVFHKRTHISIIALFCSLLLQSQGISFSSQIVDDNFDGPGGIFVGDINNDGDIDLVCGGRDANEIRCYRNDILTYDPEINNNTEKFELKCFPVPSNEEINLSYTITNKSNVTIQIYDFTGKLVVDILKKEQLPGNYNIIWERSDNKGNTLHPGTYFCRLQTEFNTIVRKIILVN